MVRVEREIPPRLLVPMCPKCGGTRIGRDNGITHIRCRRCGHDLYTDRPRSYAEMEGLVRTLEPRFHTEARRNRLLTIARAGFARLRVKLGIR